MNTTADSELEAGASYLCVFEDAPANTAGLTIKLKSILPYEEWGKQKIVEAAMESWRLRFIGSYNLTRWYKAHGEQAFMMLAHQPESVAQLLKLNSNSMLRLKNEVATLKSHWNELKFLLKHHMPMDEAERALDVFNAQIEPSACLNPFLLLTVQKNISKVARHRYFQAMGVYERCKTDLPAMISGYLDTQMQRTGESAMELEEAIKAASDALRESKATIEYAIEGMVKSGTAQIRLLHGQQTVSMGRMLANDIALAEGLAMRNETKDSAIWIQDFQPEVLPDGRIITLTTEQEVALQAVFSANTCVITGGPGTGKSTVTKSLIREVRRLNPNGRIYLAAPTGKAARRISEVTGEEAYTLHRLMGMTPGSSPMLAGFTEYDTLILDEASLMDVFLLASALKQTGKRGRVIFGGDRDQLGSIDTGAVLNDIIESRFVTTAELTEPHRAALMSDIVKGSYAVKAGEMPQFAGREGDLHFITAESAKEVNHKIMLLVKDVMPRVYNTKLDDIQVLAAMFKGDAGVDQLNENLKPLLNPASQDFNTPCRNLGNQTYHVGDRVMQLRNRYDLDIQNGEVGKILAFDEAKKSVLIEVDNRVIPLPFDNHPYLTHAGAMSVHKSQGSEYQCVLISVPDDHEFRLDRQAIFTAITRGKSQVCIIGKKETLARVIKKQNVRLTHLPFLIAEQICAASAYEDFQKLAEQGKTPKIPKPKHRVRAEDIEITF
jgi:exodeoxyribonuclease V alpha subunit